jgi:plasmid stabilization system protein ParE
MQHYTIRFIALAQDDKRNIKAYLSRFYPKTPVKFLAALKRQLQGLRENPYQYPVYLENPAYRKLVASSYLVFYQIDEDQKLVKIHRIIPGSWDIPQHLS